MLKKDVSYVGRVGECMTDSKYILFTVNLRQETTEGLRQVHGTHFCWKTDRDDKINAALQKYGNPENRYQFIKDMNAAVFP